MKEENRIKNTSIISLKMVMQHLWTKLMKITSGTKILKEVAGVVMVLETRLITKVMQER